MYKTSNLFKGSSLIITGLLAFFLIDPFEYGYLAGYLLTVAIYLKKGVILKSLDIDFLILFGFSAVFALFSFLNSDYYFQTILFYGLFPPVFYLLGKYLQTKTEGTTQLSMLLIGVGFLYSFTALISVLNILRQGGFIDFERLLPLFWNGKPKSATLMAAYFTFNMCIPAFVIIRLQKFRIFFVIITTLIFILSLLCIFRLGSRTQLAICFIILIGNLLFIVPKQSLSQNIRLFFILVFLTGIVLLYVPLDTDAQYLSTLGRRLQESDNTGTAGGRTERWVKSLNNLFVKPFGWQRAEFGYSHNLWLDVARIHGLIPFFWLIVFSLRSWIITRKAILIQPKNIELNSIMFSYIIAANLLFFVEPVTEGIFSIFLVYCFFYGAIKNYYQTQQTKLT